MEPAIHPATPRPRGALDAIARLLRAGAAETDDGLGRPACLVLGIIGLALFGAAHGFFQGGSQVLLAGLKVVLVGAFALLLVLPSLFLITALAGLAWTGASFSRTVARYWAVVGLGCASLAPVGFVFSASSRYLGSLVVWCVLFLVVALALGYRLLAGLGAAKGALFFWSLLAALVALQTATLARPILWRPPGAPAWAAERMGFAQHFASAARVSHPSPPPEPSRAPAPGR